MVSVVPPRYNPGMISGRKKATYADVLAAPEHMVAEVLDGELFLFPRPSMQHGLAATSLAGALHNPFRLGRGGPGGWLIVIEPELHLHDDIVVPDVAGWRVERMARMPVEPYTTVAPDWVCEVMSPSTRRIDRLRKRPLYAKHGVAHLWMIDPIDRSFESFHLYRERWQVGVDAGDDDRVRAEPFESFELELGLLWETAAPASADPAPPP